MKKLTSILITILTLAALPGFARGQNAPAKPLISDAFGLTTGRAAGAELKGLAVEGGSESWNTYGHLILAPEGGLTTQDDGAFLAIAPLPPLDATKILRVEADIKATGSNYIALAMLTKGDPGQFWKAAGIWAFLKAGGNFGVFSDGATNTLFQGNTTRYTFKPDDFNHVQLDYDMATETVSLSINGTSVLADKPVITPPPPITHIGIRFEGAKAGLPVVKNFSVSLVGQ